MATDPYLNYSAPATAPTSPTLQPGQYFGTYGITGGNLTQEQVDWNKQQNAMASGSFTPTTTSIAPKPTTVITPALAQTNQNKIVSDTNALTSQMAAQAQAKAATPAPVVSEVDMFPFSQKQAKAQQYGIANYVGSREQDQLLLQKMQEEKATLEASLKKGAGYIPPTPTAPTTEGAPSTQEFSTEIKSQLDRIDEMFKEMQQKQEQLKTGAIPLTADQQAQIDATQRLFERTRQEQIRANANYEAAVNMAGIRSGRYIYAAERQASNVAEAAKAGQMAIDDLDAKAASTIASLRMSFQTNNFNQSRQLYEDMSNLLTKRKELIQKQYDLAKTAYDDAQKLAAEARKDVYEQVTKPIESIQNIAAEAFAPMDIQQKIAQAKSVNEAIAAAGPYLAKATGELGEYYQDVRDAQMQGYMPVDYQTWKINKQEQEARAKAAASYQQAYATAAGKRAAEAKYGVNLEGTYTQGENPEIDAYARQIQDGTIKLQNVPPAQRGAVALALTTMGNAPDGKPTTTEMGKNALREAKNLLEMFDAGKGTGIVGASRFWAGGAISQAIGWSTDQRDFETTYKAVKDALSLDAAKYLKGQGAVSDAERAMLAGATTKLDPKQSKPEFRKTLVGIISRLEGNADGQPSAMTQIESFVGSPQSTNLISDQLKQKMQAQGVDTSAINTAGELVIYLQRLPGASPEKVLTTLQNLNIIQ